MAKITNESHMDHNLNPAQVKFLEEQIAGIQQFCIKTVELPTSLGTLPCALHGPLMGDTPVGEDEVSYEVRGDRPGASRLCNREQRQVKQLSFIVGPHGNEVVLYTAFGGPVSPREPFDPGLDETGKAESESFWAQHALSR